MTSDDGSGRAERVGSGGVSLGPQARCLPIAEHGLIGDLRTVALVGTDGTIDWYCRPGTSCAFCPDSDAAWRNTVAGEL